VIVIALIVVGLFAFVIAFAAVGREARRLDKSTPQPTFTVDEAVEWVASNLPTEITAEISYDDVRCVVEWSVEFLRSRGVYVTGSAPHQVEDFVTVGGAETLSFVMDRAAEAGAELTGAQVQAILDAELSYLEAIGAVGPEADDLSS
jgi:hypothetical protein